MIEINLLPEEYKKKRRAAPKIELSKVDLKALPIVNIALMVIGVVAAVQIFLLAAGIALGFGFNIMEKEYKDISPEKERAQVLKTQMMKMKNKVAAIDELMVKRFSWAKKLSDLNDSMSAGVWLTALEYDEKLAEILHSAQAGSAAAESAQGSRPSTEKGFMRYLIMSGAASSMGEEGTASIGRFIKGLKANPGFYSDFSDIELGAIMREKVDDQEVMTFRITCPFKIK